MSGTVLRAVARGDEPQLRALWRDVFHDGDDVIGAFFDCLYVPEDTLVAACGGEIVSAAYLLRGVGLCNGRESRPAAYFYALATRPDCRSLGLGRAITRACIRKCAERGETLCLMPGEEGLRRWYAETAGLRSFGTARKIEAEASAADAIELREIGAAQYAAQREAFLTGTPHAALPEPFFRFQARLCTPGGALLSLRGADGETGLACAGMEDGAALIPELLWTGEAEAAAAAVAAHLGASRAAARMPGEGLQTVMGAAPNPEPPFWWGPVFD